MTDENSQQSPSDETKRKFREALERKKQQGETRMAAPGGESSVHGVHGKAGNRREFRRKSS